MPIFKSNLPAPKFGLSIEVGLKAGLSIKELTDLTGANVEALEAGDKTKIRMKDTIVVFEYFEGLNK